ncbi:tetratricopeptide repeat protein [Sagittula salina]|uniref:Tetratricopeptide repeat protein n=1 Tax=Sagittula salina TaxID=2820268 RepID=A0A940S220_9RHOB|nr:tetratricopeptide repeat protein [Sagittula salina]
MRLLALLTALCFALALIVGGTAPFGRLLLAARLPALAAATFSDPEWKGAALYRAGRYPESQDAFVQARAFYNLGTAAARQGRYAEALEAYDRVIHGGDADARANFDLIAGYYAGLGIDPAALGLFAERGEGPVAPAPIAQGNARGAGKGDAVTNNNTMLGLVELDTRGRQGVRRVFDDRFMLADERWLEQLSDVPGEYMKARIALERKRREAAGLAPPDPEDPR